MEKITSLEQAAAAIDQHKDDTALRAAAVFLLAEVRDLKAKVEVLEKKPGPGGYIIGG